MTLPLSDCAGSYDGVTVNGTGYRFDRETGRFVGSVVMELPTPIDRIQRWREPYPTMRYRRVLLDIQCRANVGVMIPGLGLDYESDRTVDSVCLDSGIEGIRNGGRLTGLDGGANVRQHQDQRTSVAAGKRV